MFSKNNTKRLSSRFTLFYKSVVPIVILLFNVVLSISVLFIFTKKYWDLYIVLVPFCFIVSLIVIYPLLKLREVFMEDEEGIIIREKVGPVKVPFSEILRVNRYMFYFFRITYFNKNGTEQKVLVMPMIREFLPTLGFGKIESFTLLKHKLRNIKRM